MKIISEDPLVIHKLERYLVFAGDYYYPERGLGDLQASAATEIKVKQALRRLCLGKTYGKQNQWFVVAEIDFEERSIRVVADSSRFITSEPHEPRKPTMQEVIENLKLE